MQKLENDAEYKKKVKVMKQTIQVHLTKHLKE